MSINSSCAAHNLAVEKTDAQRKARSRARPKQSNMHGARDGFIVLPRSQINHPLLDTGPYDRRSAWMWLITSARWAPGKLETKSGDVVFIERGQLAVTDTYLAAAWEWDRMKVRRFIEAITKASMIRSDRTQALRVITICDYEEFQRLNPMVDQKARTNRAETVQNQNDKTPRKQNNQKAAPSGRGGPFSEIETEAYAVSDLVPEMEIEGDPIPASTLRKRVMVDGLPLLRGILGKPDHICRPLLGRLLKLARDDGQRVIDCLHDCERVDPVEPRSWLLAACTYVAGPKPTDGLSWMTGLVAEDGSLKKMMIE